jgi:hypothetical protein
MKNNEEEIEKILNLGLCKYEQITINRVADFSKSDIINESSVALIKYGFKLWR